jgi:hypothetical protein
MSISHGGDSGRLLWTAGAFAQRALFREPASDKIVALDKNRLSAKAIRADIRQHEVA